MQSFPTCNEFVASSKLYALMFLLCFMAIIDPDGVPELCEHLRTCTVQPSLMLATNALAAQRRCRHHLASPRARFPTCEVAAAVKRSLCAAVLWHSTFYLLISHFTSDCSPASSPPFLRLHPINNTHFSYTNASYKTHRENDSQALTRLSSIRICSLRTRSASTSDQRDLQRSTLDGPRHIECTS